MGIRLCLDRKRLELSIAIRQNNFYVHGSTSDSNCALMELSSDLCSTLMFVSTSNAFDRIQRKSKTSFTYFTIITVAFNAMLYTSPLK